MPHIGKPYRIGANWYISEAVKHPDGCQATRQVPLSDEDVRRMNGLAVKPKTPAYVRPTLERQLEAAKAAGLSPDDIHPFDGSKPGESTAESYQQRLKRAEQLEHKIASARKTTPARTYRERPLSERVAEAIAAKRRVADVRPFDGRYAE